MKVMSICDRWVRDGKEVHPSPKYGEIVFVSGETNDGVAYILPDYPLGLEPIKGWHKKGFIPCSEIDEREMHREYNFEKVLK